MSMERISDQSDVLRHVPGGTTWQAPGPRITSKNFELRPGETGISVSRDDITPANALMARLGNPAAGSRIASASVSAIHNLGLEVAPDPKDYDAGHAEIRSGKADLSSRAVRKQLAKLFTFLPEASGGT
jgi:cytochrome c5